MNCKLVIYCWVKISPKALFKARHIYSIPTVSASQEFKSSLCGSVSGSLRRLQSDYLRGYVRLHLGLEDPLGNSWPWAGGFSCSPQA